MCRGKNKGQKTAHGSIRGISREKALGVSKAVLVRRGHPTCGNKIATVWALGERKVERVRVGTLRSPSTMSKRHGPDVVDSRLSQP